MTFRKTRNMMRQKTSRANSIPVLQRLKIFFAHAVVITDEMYGQDEVSPGCRFQVEDVEFGDVEEYHFVGSRGSRSDEWKNFR